MLWHSETSFNFSFFAYMQRGKEREKERERGGGADRTVLTLFHSSPNPNKLTDRIIFILF